MRFKKQLIILTVVATGFLIYLGLSGQQKAGKLAVISTSPVSKSLNASTKNPININFNKDLLSETPYSQFTINPVADGRVTVNNKAISFVPAGQLRPDTEYTISIFDVQSAADVISEYSFNFTTGKQKLSSFEQGLPISTNEYTIDRLSDGTIIVTVTSTPADLNASKALEFLKSNGVDTSKVLVQKAPSSRDN